MDATAGESNCEAAMVTPSTPPLAPHAPVDIDAQSGGATSQRECGEATVNLVVPASSPAKRRRVDHPQAPPAAGKTLTRDSEVSAVVATRVAHGLRWVEPYHHTFETHAKGRWVGREVLEVFAKEFQSEPREAYEHAIEAGRITINGLPVTATTIVRDNDLIRNTAHRHEPPVIATELDIIHEDDSVVAVDKPASMPVHACGRYRYNTVQSILDRELGRPGLLPCHRLDRLTSGVLIFAKNQASAKHMQSQMQGHHLQKVYVCRVRGAFPEGVTTCAAPIKVVCHKLGVCSVDPSGKPCETTFELMHSNRDGTSIVRCTPRTGRMHQIRVHLQHLGFPIENDPVYNLSTDADGNVGKPEDWTVDRAMAQVTTTLAARDADSTRVDVSGDTTAASAEMDGIDWRKTDHYDPSCSECQLWRPFPKPETLFIYLHAFEYSGPDWTIRTKLPRWAEKDAA